MNSFKLNPLLAGYENAILHRCDHRVELTPAGQSARRLSLLGMAREYMATFGQDSDGMDRFRLASEVLQFRSGWAHGHEQRSMQTTSDFAMLLGNVANKRLRQMYDDNEPTYMRWARRGPDARDFRAMNVVQLGAAPDLLQVSEHGEFKYGTFSDGAETYSILTYGRTVGFTRQALLNDDLRAFERMTSMFAASARRLENRLVYSQLTANAALSDGIAVFHANHGNLATGGGSALQTTALATGRTAMLLQKGRQGEELSLRPSFLIVPASLETTAYQLTSTAYVPATPSAINEFRSGGRAALEPVVDAVLDSTSLVAWYLACGSSHVDTVEYCYLEGTTGPVVDSEVGFDYDGISYRCRHDFGTKVIDYRGLYKAAGV